MRVAEYGASFGGKVYDERDVVWFWTERGLCKATPFENLTDKQLVTQDRSFVTSSLLNWQGSRYAIVHQFGGVTTKRSGSPYEPLIISSNS
jgi:hypothetical protein